jgi:hypothetical protein
MNLGNAAADRSAHVPRTAAGGRARRASLGHGSQKAAEVAADLLMWTASH